MPSPVEPAAGVYAIRTSNGKPPSHQPGRGYGSYKTPLTVDNDVGKLTVGNQHLFVVTPKKYDPIRGWRPADGIHYYLLQDGTLYPYALGHFSDVAASSQKVQAVKDRAED